jgi:DNA polymerase-3 subunit gamma/tau
MTERSDKRGKKAATADGPTPEYQVLARKYRPQTFADLIGQEAMVRTLTNAFAAGRIAHAFMLTGVRGVGKTTTARLLARALNYQREGEAKDDRGPTIDLEPPGVHCAAIAASRHTDVLEMDAASRTGVGDVREILEGVRYAAQSARTKVYIIDEVHMLSTQAFNALLKTLEEPPAHVKFIFATTEIRKVPVTVLSRCQRFDLKRVDPEVLLGHLKGIAAKEGAEVAEDGLKLIVRAAEGSVRDALSLLDQAIVQGAPNDKSGGATSAEAVRDMLGLADRARTFELLAQALAGEAGAALSGLESLRVDGADPVVVMRDLLDHCHDVTRAKVVGGEARFADAADQVARIRALADASALGHLTRAWQLLLKAYEEIRAAPDPQAAAEMALVRLAHAAGLPPPEAAAKLLAETGAATPSAAPITPAAVAAAPRAPAAAPSARRRAAGGGEAEQNTAPEAALADPTPDDEPMLEPRSESLSGPLAPSGARAHPLTWAGVAALAGENRDLILKTDLERTARPVRVEPGRIVFQPMADARPDLAAVLARSLQAWTGRAWFVHADAHAQGGETLAEQRAREGAEALARAMEDPLVAEALALWPDAEIKIRPRAANTEDPEP